MAKFQVQKNILVVQISHNQLAVRDLDGKDDKKITINQAIQKFAMSSEDDLVGVLTINNHFELYRLSSGSKHSIANTIDHRQADILLLRHNALWLGSYDDSSKSINLSIASLSDHPVKSVTIGLQEHKDTMVMITYHHHRDHVALLFKRASSSLLCYYRIVKPDELQLVRQTEIASTMTHCCVNVDGTLVCCWHENDRIVLVDGEQSVDHSSQLQIAIKGIHFDGERPNMMVVTSSRVMYHLVYLGERRRLALHETIKLYSPSLLAYRMPTTYSLEGGKNIVARKHAQLDVFLANESFLLDLLNEDYERFVCRLRNANTGESMLWHALAKRCIQARDMESALFAFSATGDAAFVRVVRQEMALYGHNSACALLALHCDMLDDVEKLLENNTTSRASAFYQVQNKWQQVFEREDKLSLKSSYFKYARQLEREGKISDAVKYYELSGNFLQVPRMFFEANNLEEMEQYCLKGDNHALVTWLGQYCESQGNLKRALELYGKARDYYNLVRLLCHSGQLEAAIEVIGECEARKPNQHNGEEDVTAAILYLGKHLENIDPQQSMEYYLKCGAILHAIRVCLVNQLYNDLVRVAVEHCSREEASRILDSYCKDNEDMINKENMVKLYYKSGCVKQSIHFAIRNHLWQQLRAICANEIGVTDRDYVVDAQDVAMILDSLQSNTSIIDIVIDLTIMSDQESFAQTAEIIKQYNINLDESLMDKLEYFTVVQNNHKLIEMFAELSLQRGNYSVAARLYNKIGDRQESVKALIRSGNTDKVIQFANVARDKTVFKIAANFLQTINHPDKALIIKYYTKADATQELDRFNKSFTSQRDRDD